MNDYTLHYAFQRQDNPDTKWEGSKTDDTYAIIFDLGEFHSFLKKYIFIKLISTERVQSDTVEGTLDRKQKDLCSNLGVLISW